MAARDVVRRGGRDGALGRGTRELVGLLDGVVTGSPAGTVTAEVVAAVVSMMASDALPALDWE